MQHPGSFAAPCQATLEPDVLSLDPPQIHYGWTESVTEVVWLSRSSSSSPGSQAARNIDEIRGLSLAPAASSRTYLRPDPSEGRATSRSASLERCDGVLRYYGMRRAEPATEGAFLIPGGLGG